jgi:pimeloyl-ACP methyl ester carboxylesterase
VRVQANGAELCVEVLGDRGDPPILLIMGSGGSMDWWDEEFCERLAAGGRFVIRYDNRDTGRSTTYPPGAPPYTGSDLVADAVAVLDAVELQRAHVVGLSSGGALAQVLALDHSDRVASLCVIATSPAGPEKDLPGMAAEDVARLSAIAAPDWSDRESVVDYLVAYSRAIAGRSRPFDEARHRRMIERAYDRSASMQSMTNHDLIDSPPRWRERLGGMRIPTLVIHGREDPLLPYPHGVALAAEIPGARLLTLEHAGHELPREDLDIVVPAILEHTAP